MINLLQITLEAVVARCERAEAESERLRICLQDSERLVRTLTEVQTKKPDQPVRWSGESHMAMSAIQNGTVRQFQCAYSILDDCALTLDGPINEVLEREVGDRMLGELRRHIAYDFGFNPGTRAHYATAGILVAEMWPKQTPELPKGTK